MIPSRGGQAARGTSTLALKARLFTAVALVACGGGETDGQGGGIGASRVGQGGAGAAGIGGGSGGAGSGGTAANPAWCPGTFTIQPGPTVCYTPEGKSTVPLVDIPVAQPFYHECAGLAHDPSGDCPPASALCDAAFCGLKAIKGVASAAKQGDACCYDTSVCVGASGCGRPLQVEGVARCAHLVASSVDWT